MNMNMNTLINTNTDVAYTQTDINMHTNINMHNAIGNETMHEAPICWSCNNINADTHIVISILLTTAPQLTITIFVIFAL